ncbi:MAG TPA: bifunctional phosphoribosyl-AMP cyclohydrolase/phosphoribosyl-ATP pyrophosphatase [Syntrophomonas sp.]|jgi:phosphoribosyl-ATP pyrophosphohydrolase/phosphoribosyl-AMP cyclohydrolase|nr:bifunctional phosphoribosyl-AMP cyclohydrolase/phosphoribosyl-ATP pyrophosphatase [Syntrophomonas sp.]
MIEQINFEKQGGLVPAVIQDATTGQVLMVAYMNETALQKTLDTGKTWFFSRSRQRLWMKGETSGHVQEVEEILFDCDQDCLLITVRQIGAACHTGHYSCFYRNIEGEEVLSQVFNVEEWFRPGLEGPGVLFELIDVIRERQLTMPENSYTSYLFSKGLDKILKKIGEESAEVIIAAKNREKTEVVYEAADLIYHLLVLLVEQGVELSDVFAELRSRR